MNTLLLSKLLRFCVRLKMKGDLVILCVAVLVLAVKAHKERLRDHDDDHIDHVNKHQAGKKGGWKAGRTSHSGLTLEEKKKLAGIILETPIAYRSDPHIVPSSAQKRIAIPASFDARLAWPNCTSIQEIRNQGRCGGCWAHAGASVISDRICIASGNAHTYFQASVQDQISCSGGTGNLCNGAYSRTAYIKYITRGVVTGGGYNSSSGCMPFTSYNTASAAATSSSNCPFACTNPEGYSKSYNDDKAYGSNWYALGNQYATTSGGAAGTVTSETVIRQIQYELMTNGPVTVQITVYEDFYHYTSGVYQHVTGVNTGAHAMKLLGWGTEGGIDYWLIANSYGTNWGIGGFIKFLRGTNHLGIEDYLVTALPQTTQAPSIIPPCSDTAASRLYCRGKWRYALAGENICTNQYCCCPGTCGPSYLPPFPASCPPGKFMDPTPSVYSDNCADPITIPACAPKTAAVVTTRSASTLAPITTSTTDTVSTTIRANTTTTPVSPATTTGDTTATTTQGPLTNMAVKETTAVPTITTGSSTSIRLVPVTATLTTTTTTMTPVITTGNTIITASQDPVTNMVGKEDISVITTTIGSSTSSRLVPVTTALMTATTIVAAFNATTESRPAGYDRCDAFFCNPIHRANGFYYISPCSRNYCLCNGGTGYWFLCPVGQYFDQLTNGCRTLGSMACPMKLMTYNLAPIVWPVASSSVSAHCNRVNCDGRGVAPNSWYTLGLCTPYWCYCWQMATPRSQAVQTCGAGLYFDFRPEVAACVNKDALPWC